MTQNFGRREMISVAGTAIVTALSIDALGQEAEKKGKIVGINCSPRKGMTTAAALSICLQAAREKNPAVETELIELAELSIPAQLAAGLPLRNGETDDFPGIVKKLGDPSVAGILVGSPVYFGNMSALCKAFLDRCMTFRKDGFILRNKVAGVLAVGSARNGGQELTIHSIQAALLCQDMIIVGDGQPTARIGAALWNQNDSIEEDDFGKEAARNLGRRVADLASMINR